MEKKTPSMDIKVKPETMWTLFLWWIKDLMGEGHRLLAMLSTIFVWAWAYSSPVFISVPEPLLEKVVLKYGIPLLATFVSYLANMNRIHRSLAKICLQGRRFWRGFRNMLRRD